MLLAALHATPAAATVYYVSRSTGSDGDDGLTPGNAFATLAKVNGLALNPGDQVRLLCGDTWRGERLVIDDSGTAAMPITYTSEPPGCANQPVVSGAQPIVGWVLDAGNVYRADLAAGGNAGRFPGGVNQLFRNGARLPYGRWPNLGTTNGGYATIDSQSGNTVTDADLLPGNWTGAYIQHRSQYWYLLRRQVTGDSGDVLTLNEAALCRLPLTQCAGWGYFLNHHRNLLDAEGEWFFDAATNRVYVVSGSGPPADNAIEGSVSGTASDPNEQSGVTIGTAAAVHHVTVDNLAVRRWAGNGIQMALIVSGGENSHVSILGNTVVDVALAGIRLASFAHFGGTPAKPDPRNGLRGGTQGVVSGNLIDGAVLDGIETFSNASFFLRNQIRNIGLLPQLNAGGMGCALTGSSCGIHGNGIRVMVAPNIPNAGFSGSGNAVRLNRLQTIGWTGIDVWGPFNLIEHNVIDGAATTLAEGAGVRTFKNFPAQYQDTPAHDITIRRNIIRNPVGNVDGVPPAGTWAWAYGINVDHYSDDVAVVGNTVAGCPAYGIIFSRARGTATDNTLWRNSHGASGVGHLRVQVDHARASNLRNVIYGHIFNRALLSIDDETNLTASDDNYYFNPYDARVVRDEDPSAPVHMTLPQWQAASGLDLASVDSWFSLTSPAPDPSLLVVNETETAGSIALPAGTFRDLDQNVVTGSIFLQPFESRILIADESVLLADGFESGDTSGWSSSVPP